LPKTAYWLLINFVLIVYNQIHVYINSRRLIDREVNRIEYLYLIKGTLVSQQAIFDEAVIFLSL
jgi:hypothetical protein